MSIRTTMYMVAAMAAMGNYYSPVPAGERKPRTSTLTIKQRKARQAKNKSARKSRAKNRK